MQRYSVTTSTTPVINADTHARRRFMELPPPLKLRPVWVHVAVIILSTLSIGVLYAKSFQFATFDHYLIQVDYAKFIPLLCTPLLVSGSFSCLDRLERISPRPIRFVNVLYVTAISMLFCVLSGATTAALGGWAGGLVYFRDGLMYCGLAIICSVVFGNTWSFVGALINLGATMVWGLADDDSARFWAVSLEREPVPASVVLSVCVYCAALLLLLCVPPRAVSSDRRNFTESD